MSDWNKAFRRIGDIPMYQREDGSFTSAVFKDSHGVSVDLDHLRDIEEVLKDEERLFHYYVKQYQSNQKLLAIASINQNDCYVNNIQVKEEPVVENPHHAILRNDDTLKLSNRQSKALARAMIIERRYTR